jgi:hypothetical protein
MSRRETAAHPATIGLAAFLAVAVVAGTAKGTASDAELNQTTGTVTAVALGPRQISVITGCGHALRVVAFFVGEGCKIQVGGVAAPLTSLRRGQIVAVRYRAGAEPCVAESIATPPTPDARGQR